MLSDIKDEPEIFRKLAEVYLPEGKPVQNIEVKTEKISKIYIIASGSSRNAGNITRYFIEAVAQIPVTVEHASEFSMRNPVLSPNDLVVFVSQSGETSDVLSALQVAKTKGAYTFAVTNNETSTIHKTADSAMFIYAGKEISVPATKSFASQLVCLYIIGIYLAEQRNSVSAEVIESYKQKIHQMPKKIEKLISNTEEIDKIAQKLHDKKSLIILGRGQNFGLAEECSLKIKETCYINAGGYPTGEFLHGHLAMLDENSPVISIITKCGLRAEAAEGATPLRNAVYGEQPRNGHDEANYTLSVGNTMQLIKKRNADVVIVKDLADSYINSKLSEFPVEYLNISEFDEDFSPVFSAVVLHLLTYKMAELLGNDVNNPRSLSKTVSNEQ